MSSATVSTIVEEVQASRAGSNEAFGRLVERYQGMVCAVAYSHTGDSALSEDIAQDTFLTAWRRLDQLQHPERLGEWLAGIARNRARDALRKRYRDPLHAAGKLDPDLPQTRANGGGPGERAAVVWEALGRLPLHYREPLVLYYREGQSVESTAAALGLSPDCVKKRLSRGRAMLRERVAALVEQTLADTRPGPAFTVAVMGSLPALMVMQTAAHAAVEGGAAGAAGKTIAAGGASMLGGLAGALAGMSGGFFGMWHSIRNAPTLRTRRCMLKCSASGYALVWGFLGYLALCAGLFADRPRILEVACAAGWVLYLPLLLLQILRGNARFKRIVEEDAGLRDAPEAALETSPLSWQATKRALWWALGVAVPASMAVLWWLGTLPFPHAFWTGALFVGVSHAMFVRLYRHGLGITRDDAIFAETAPRWDALAWLSREEAARTGPAPRERFWHDVFMLLGTVWGPAAWLIAMPAQGGEWWLSGLAAVNCLLVSAAGIALLKNLAGARRFVLAALYLYMGLSFGAMAVFALVFGWAGDGLRLAPAAGWTASAIYPAVYVILAIAMLRIRHEPWATSTTQARDNG